MSRTVLFYGCGWAATNIWMPNLRRAGSFDFLCIDQHLFAQAAARGAVPPCLVLDSVEDLAAQTIDLAIVASPNSSHAEHAQALLTRGITTIVEKPVCLSRQDCAAMSDTARSSGAQLLRSCASCYDPHFRAFVDLVAGFDVSEISTVRAEWTRTAGVPSSKWLTSARHAVAGSSLDLGWHLLECVAMLLGYQEMDLKDASFRFPDASGTAFARWYGTEASGPEPVVDVDLAASLCLETAGGTSVDIKTSWDEEVSNDAVRFTVAGDRFALELETIFGLSRNGPRQMGITGHRHGERVDIRLAAKTPGRAHEIMIRQYAAAGFDPERLDQNLGQLAVLATAAEQIISQHDACREQALGSGDPHVPG